MILFGKKRQQSLFEKEVFVYLDKLYMFAFHLTGQEADAEDLLQETLERAFRGFKNFKIGTNTKAWLYTIMLNIVRNKKKKEFGEVVYWDESLEQYPEPSDTNPEIILLKSSIRERLMQCMKKLPEEYRIVLLLADLEEYSYKEIAEIMDIPVGTVMSRLFRARRILKNLLIKESGKKSINEMKGKDPYGM